MTDGPERERLRLVEVRKFDFLYDAKHAEPHPKSAVPIIALTANAMSGVEEQYREVGMDGYVAKPIQTAELFAKLSQIARARDQLEVLSEDNAEASPN